MSEHRTRLLAAHPDWDAATRLRFDAAYARVRALSAPVPMTPVMMALSNAQRQKRWRQRRRNNADVFVVAVKNSFEKIDWLIDNGLLAEKDSEDADLVSAALARLIDRCCRK
jgi:hypothetical protein